MSEPFRIPLAGSINSRILTPNTLSLSTAIVGSAIVGVAVVGGVGTASTKDQKFINCFSQTITNPYTGNKTTYLVKRPGFGASGVTPQAGSVGNDILIWTGSGSKIISAYGATNSSIYDSATQLVTNAADTTKITGLARSITETELSGTATITIASTDSTGWFYQPAGTVTKIADVDYPGNAGFTTVGGFAHLAGYAFIMTSDGKIWNSDINGITPWTSTSFLTANAYPDSGVGVFAHGEELIMAFGTESIQFFHNAGNASGSPLSRVTPKTLRIGCVNADAIVDVTGTMFWVGSSPQGGIAVYSYGSGPQRISNPIIEALLLLAGTSNISLAAVKFFGMSFILVQAQAVTFAYCIEESAWFEMTSTTALWYRTAGVSLGTQVTYAISKNNTSGKIYIINPAAHTFLDDGAQYYLVAQTSLIGDANARTVWNEITVEGDVELSTSNLWVSHSDDDYRTNNTLGLINMAATPRRKLTRLGSAYRRSWIVSHGANTPLRLQALVGRKTMGVS